MHVRLWFNCPSFFTETPHAQMCNCKGSEFPVLHPWPTSQDII